MALERYICVWGTTTPPSFLIQKNLQPVRAEVFLFLDKDGGALEGVLAFQGLPRLRPSQSKKRMAGLLKASSPSRAY